MPVYEFRCSDLACGHVFEELTRSARDEPDKCPKCGHPNPIRALSAPRFQLRGTGWYTTDFRNNGKPEPAETKASAKSDTAPDSAESKEKPDSGGAKNSSGAKKPNSSDSSDSTSAPTGGA